MREVDLYAPVRDWLIANGYEVQAEVGRCDIAARREDDLILIELKCRFGTELLVQAIERQSACESVYIAIPAPECSGRSSRWRGLKKLVRRLELGLLFVRCGDTTRAVEPVLHPMPAQRRKQKRQRMAVLREMDGRSGDFNVGGSTRRKLITAYRESAIRIGCCLQHLGALSPRRLRELGMGPKTLSILSRNVYGWYERVGRGQYAISARGREELSQYEFIVEKTLSDLTAEISGERSSVL